MKLELGCNYTLRYGRLGPQISYKDGCNYEHVYLLQDGEVDAMIDFLKSIKRNVRKPRFYTKARPDYMDIKDREDCNKTVISFTFKTGAFCTVDEAEQICERLNKEC